MIDYSNCSIEHVSVHHIGNKTNGEDLILSKSPLDISDEQLKDLLMRFFIFPMTSNELFNFTFSNQNFKLNPLYNFAVQTFDDADSFHEQSKDISKHLFEVSNHPQIKAGDLFIAYFKGIGIDEKTVNAIGIFKSENKQSFLKLDKKGQNFLLDHEDGINIEKLDKGCLIFNTDRKNGLKICIVDKSNRSSEAQFWKDTFLMLKPCADEYHHTKQFLDITKNYVTKQLTEEFEVSKADQIDVLNRSMQYFKNHETFDKQEFEKEVLQDAGVIKSFRKYDETFREENDIELDDTFDISTQAVKKQARIFKSVLKLDKNFHIYIHGNKDLIEQGVDKDGRKYYKIYFDKEF
ncbi:MAG: nucleoid-associated protein [Bacteroidia bacterium]|nr:nucleoid-associated protein [Bacteroidia bacterium]